MREIKKLQFFFEKKNRKINESEQFEPICP